MASAAAAPSRAPVESEPPTGVEADEIFRSSITTGGKRLSHPSTLTLIKAVVAGFYVTFGALAALTLYGYMKPGIGKDAAWALASVLYPLGFLFVIFGRSELYTENFLAPVHAVWYRRSGGAALAKLWALTLVGNLLGVAVMALLWSAEPLHLMPEPARAAFSERAVEDLARPALAVFVGGAFAGMLINFMSWLIMSGRSPLTKVAFILGPTFLVMLLRLNHSISGGFEVLTGVLINGSGLDSLFLKWLPLAILGNAVGGLLLVAGFYYAEGKAEARHRGALP
ncbi:MAG TPA: formate/nitrite transporter family protein [Candidatus Thermoplasmatota archaeon]|nr:formate/nitrite transporter family protein [Candidatus Thermoplasmatota archaeon]